MVIDCFCWQDQQIHGDSATEMQLNAYDWSCVCYVRSGGNITAGALTSHAPPQPRKEQFTSNMGILHLLSFLKTGCRVWLGQYCFTQRKTNLRYFNCLKS